MKIGQVRTALSEYNEAVLWAEPDSETLALALANRSVVLGKMKFHTPAVDDLQCVLR